MRQNNDRVLRFSSPLRSMLLRCFVAQFAQELLISSLSFFNGLWAASSISAAVEIVGNRQGNASLHWIDFWYTFSFYKNTFFRRPGWIFLFLDVTTHLCKRSCQSICRSVRRCVRRSVSSSIRPSLGPSIPCHFWTTNKAVFEGKKSSNDILNNGIMSKEEVVASDVPPRYLFQWFQSLILFSISYFFKKFSLDDLLNCSLKNEKV